MRVETRNMIGKSALPALALVISIGGAVFGQENSGGTAALKNPVPAFHAPTFP